MSPERLHLDGITKARVMRKPHRGAAIDPEERSLIAELYPSLRRFASTVRNPGQDGNDLVQEALLRVPERGSLL